MYSVLLTLAMVGSAEPTYVGRSAGGCVGTYSAQYVQVVQPAVVLAQSTGCVGSYSAARPSIVRPVRGPLRRIHAQRVIAGSAIATAGIAPYTAFGYAIPAPVVHTQPVASKPKKKAQVIVP